MRRSLNAKMSLWFRAHAIEGNPLPSGALCRDYLDLPWVSDVRPTSEETVEMRMVCTQCPIIAECARYAMTGGDYGHPVAGGFYAGHLLPWKSPGEGLETRELRRRSRYELRVIAGLRQPAVHV